MATGFGFARSGGALITDVQPSGAADRAAVQPGYRIIAIDDAQIGSAEEARRALRRLRRGHVASLLLQAPDESTLIFNIRVP